MYTYNTVANFEGFITQKYTYNTVANFEGFITQKYTDV
jgi:hypothetical protein